MPTLLRARVVYPVAGPPLDGGVVTIEGERIVAVETAAAASGRADDLGDVALQPGLVNAHTHLEFSHLRQPLGRPGMKLFEWLPLAIAERQSRGDRVADSIAAGIEESRAAGACAVGEIATVDDYPAQTDLAFVRFLEVIGFSRARAASAFVAVETRLRELKGSSVGLSPHAPYTVSPDLLGKLVRLAHEQRLPVAMHLAESAEELEFLSSGTGPLRDLLDARSMWDAEAIPRGSRPLDYLRLLAGAPRALVIHGNYLARAEQEFLAEHADRMTLVYCPRTHAYFGHPPYPLGDLLAAGVRVALGTDSRASNPGLDPLGEIRQAVRAHSDVPADAILEMATLRAAEALGCDQDCGSIAPGKLANLVALPMRGSSLAEAFAESSQAAGVWLRGRKL